MHLISLCVPADADIVKFYGCELGAQTKYDKKDGTSIVNGAHDTSKLCELLEVPMLPWDPLTIDGVVGSGLAVSLQPNCHCRLLLRTLTDSIRPEHPIQSSCCATAY